MKAKYVKSFDDQIITFPLGMNHSDFRSFRPKSAGFISIGSSRSGEVLVSCWGKSITLDLDSDPEVDATLAKTQYKQF